MLCLFVCLFVCDGRPSEAKGSLNWDIPTSGGWRFSNAIRKYPKDRRRTRRDKIICFKQKYLIEYSLLSIKISIVKWKILNIYHPTLSLH